MIVILEEMLDEIRKAWEHCGFVISDEEIFKIAEEVHLKVNRDPFQKVKGGLTWFLHASHFTTRSIYSASTNSSGNNFLPTM